MINAAAERVVSPVRREAIRIPGAVSPLCMCACVRRLRGWAKSGLRGGLQSSTPRLWLAFEVTRCLWWLPPWRNAAHPPSPPKKPPELWNAAQAAAAQPTGMGLEYRPILPFLAPPHLPPLSHPALCGGQHGGNLAQSVKFGAIVGRKGQYVAI